MCQPGTSNSRGRSFRPHVRVVEMSHDDAWMRDVGPTFVTNDAAYGEASTGASTPGEGFRVGSTFPGTRTISSPARCSRSRAAIATGALIINEGGAIHVDGEGTALVTEQVLLNPNRNPGIAKEEIERHLKAYLGVQAVIWLGEGVVDDETGGHIDNLACFVRPGAVALHWTDSKRDPQFAVSQDALERLSAARDARGRRLTVIKLPLPGPLRYRPR